MAVCVVDAKDKYWTLAVILQSRNSISLQLNIIRLSASTYNFFKYNNTNVTFKFGALSKKLQKQKKPS